MDVRGDLQALDLKGLRETLAGDQDVLFEGNPFVGTALLDAVAGTDVPLVSAFMSPLSRDEVLFLREQPSVNLPALVTDVMRRKLLRRTQRQKGILSLKDLEEVERRAGSAYRELGLAWRFQHVIVNHDGEDSENWDAFYYPLADARRALLDFVALLRGQPPRWAETWEQDLVPAT